MSDKLLLHACCAPCGAYSAEFLKEAGYDVTFYYYNPNIYPVDEYKRRLLELEKYSNANEYDLIVENPDFENWENSIKGFELEPEKGKRCEFCYAIRLEKTAQFAQKNKFDFFTTTLSISPHKSYELIRKISLVLQDKYNVNYLDVNLKKKDGYKKSVELSKKYGFYRQDYCGCKYSIRA